MSPQHAFISMLAAALASIAIVGLAVSLFPSIGQGAGETSRAKHGPMRPDASITHAPPPSVWERLGANIGPEEQPAVFLQPEPDWGAIGQPCPSDDRFVTQYCSAVPPSDPAAVPERTIYTLGNSHSILLTNALLEVVGRQPTWSTRAQAEPGCVFSMTPTPTTPCEKLWATGTAYILAEQPDLVVVMGTRSAPPGMPENLLPGLTDWIRAIESQTTTEVITVRDSPRFAVDPAACLHQNEANPAACEQPAGAGDVSAHAADVQAAGAAWIDLTGDICPGMVCPAVRGGLQTYLDANHVTGSYWRTLAPPLARGIHAEIDWWPADPYDGVYDNRTSEPASPVI